MSANKGKMKKNENPPEIRVDFFIYFAFFSSRRILARYTAEDTILKLSQMIPGGEKLKTLWAIQNGEVQKIWQ